ncbi:GNAT family N-acetyltransferase [Streptomyces sp. NPDC059003]|uniref:GNAT family N-acetyltransferase n=1 Tax=Streptomyces sp. NPDC059003 TaxID=3346691 RepID=UPI0036ACBB44
MRHPLTARELLVYVMRPAVAGDQDPIAAMVRARRAWMRERGIPDWPRTEADVQIVASQAASPAFPVWVLTEGERVIGCTSVFTKTPEWGWAPEELLESALFLATSFTHPDHRQHQPGRLMAWWALDRAARDGITCVRRGTFVERLMVYYRDAQGWHLVHTPQRKGRTAYLMTRRAEPMPELAELVTDSGVPLG